MEDESVTALKELRRLADIVAVECMAQCMRFVFRGQMSAKDAAKNSWHMAEAFFKEEVERRI
jgi:hypothetical protein